MPDHFKKTSLIFILPLIVIIGGTIGFMAIEKLNFINAVYFTFVTVSTVGYGDIHPVTTSGKLFAILVIFIGIGSFLAIVTTLTQALIASGEARLRKIRINMLIGLYFTEVGNQLLRILVPSDPARDSFRTDFMVNSRWAAADFEKLKAVILKRENNVDPKLVDLSRLLSFLKEKGGFLTRQLENPDLTENTSFCDLLWASVHLRDELMARPGLTDLPASDLNHLALDAKRVYNLLVKQWLDYMRHLQNRYPYQFSLTVRTNPFSENPSPTVKDA